MTAGVYWIHCKANDTYYVGETTNFEKRIRTEHARELRDGRHHNRHLQLSWNRYGQSAFTFKLVWAVPCESHEILGPSDLSMLTRSMEAVVGYAMIQAGFRLFNLRGFDRWGVGSPMTTPSIRALAAASIRSPEVRAKISEAAKRARLDPEKSARINAAVNSGSARKKRSDSVRADWGNPDRRSHRMKYWTDDVRAKHSDLMKSVLASPEVAAKVRQTIDANKRKVRRLDTGETFDSVLDAAVADNTSSQNIIQAIKNGWRARGSYWSYC